jgi:hypothetical protein
MSEGLVYSVNRTPERIFDTARDVQVTTQEEILHANVQSLGQLLSRQLGIGVVDGESGTMPLVRGLGGNAGRTRSTCTSSISRRSSGSRSFAAWCRC